MRIAALYDIHGNLPALEAVLEEVRRSAVDRIVIGGDVVPGPLPRETLERLLLLDIPLEFIRGNGDRVVSAVMQGAEPVEVPEQFRDNIRWSAQQLHARHGKMLAGWPSTLRADTRALGSILFCHATPQNDTDIFTRRTAEERLLPIFSGVDASLVVCGHTHMQFDRKVGNLRVVNAGSVGMPFGRPGAYWLLLGDDIELRHTTYDLDSAARRIRNSGYPQAEVFAARNVLQPLLEQAMVEAYGAVELKSAGGL